MNGIDDTVLNFSPANLTLLNAILAIVMFSIALDLRGKDFVALRRAPRPLLAGLFSQFIVLPALTFALILLFRPQPSVALGLILVAACPGGSISNFITFRAGGNVALSVSMTAIATVSALFMTPVNIAFWGNLYAPTRGILRAIAIDPVSLGMTVAFMLVLPLTIGVLINTHRPDIAEKIRRPMQHLSMVIFVAFIGVALAANWGYLMAFLGTVLVMVVVHNALAFAAGFGVASLARVSAFDRRAITIETGIQNSGLGLVLIFGYFGGLGGMAVTAALWGVWHGISGMILAALFARSGAVR